MLLLKRNSLLLLCLLLAACQKADLTVGPEDGEKAGASEEVGSIIGTGQGSSQCPYTVTDLRSLELPAGDAVWVIGYMVGTAPRAMGNAVFSTDADNQSNILLAADSLCTDPEHCIPVELSSAKNKANFSLPKNTAHFRKCLLLKGIPSTYLYRKGLRSVSAGLWLDGFDISSVEPTGWGSIILQQP
ncbi:MAG: hypothetical protein IJT11_06095 [Bacteroidaceae bacterium]|nr:hypothetical protein [Bacteroidaceae bacterium]